ncbi:MAG: sulfite exporter TauE/SafE family protein [Polyangiales bacterium]
MLVGNGAFDDTRQSVTLAPLPLILLTLTAFAAGAVDAIGGGGGLLTLPALLFAGLPPHLALGTNKGVSTFGTGAATLTFARAGKLSLRPSLLGFGGGALGAVAGARLQLSFDNSALRPMVLVMLVVVAVVLVAHQARPRSGHRELQREAHVLPSLAIAVVMGAYDGFFGPGTGTFLIVAHAALLKATLAEATAAAKAVNWGSNCAALITFGMRGTVLWAVALPMAAGNIAGGVLGARVAVKGGDRVVRQCVVVVSLALIAKLAIDLVHKP